MQFGGQNGTAIVNSNGKTTGVRFVFSGDVKASDLRKQLKEANPLLKGKALTQAVDEVLAGKRTKANALGTALVSAMCEEGYQFDVADIRSKTAAVRFVKPSVKVLTPEEQRAAAMKALGLTPEQVAAALKLTPAQIGAL